MQVFSFSSEHGVALLLNGTFDTFCTQGLLPSGREDLLQTYPVNRETMAFVLKRGGENVSEAALRVLKVFPIETMLIMASLWLLTRAVLSSSLGRLVKTRSPCLGLFGKSRPMLVIYGLSLVFFGGVYQTCLVNRLLAPTKGQLLL